MVGMQSSTPVINKPELFTIRSNPPANMSVFEASVYLGVSERKLRDSIAKREIKHVRFGSRVILRKVDLDAFLEQRICA